MHDTCKNEIHKMYLSSNSTHLASSLGHTLLPVSPNPKFQSCQVMEQLRSILTLTLTHMWILQALEGSNHEEEMQSSWDTVLPLLFPPFLRTVSNAVLMFHSGVHDEQQHRQKLVTATSWDQHSLLEFDGKLLPICCNQGCRNMGGFSEATLPTLLCGGCRMVRYCSTGFQRASWTFEGHSMNCLGARAT